MAYCDYLWSYSLSLKHKSQQKPSWDFHAHTHVLLIGGRGGVNVRASSGGLWQCLRSVVVSCLGWYMDQLHRYLIREFWCSLISWTITVTTTHSQHLDFRVWYSEIRVGAAMESQIHDSGTSTWLILKVEVSKCM